MSCQTFDIKKIHLFEKQPQIVLGMKMPNIAGRGESIHCEYSRGLHKSSNYSLTFSKPYPYLKVEPV